MTPDASAPPLPPPFALSRLATSYWAPQAVYAAAALGIADALGDGPRDAAAIARTVQADAGALGRLLRALVVLGIVADTGDGAYELTPLGACLRSGTRDSVRSWVLLVGGPICWNAWGRLVDVVRTGKPVPALDGHGSWVDWQSTHPEAAAVFDDAMVELTRQLAAAIAVSYDFAGLGTIVDVGGGYGALLPPILKANPGLRGIVFDLPKCRDGARRLIEKTGLAERYEFVGGSFFDDAIPRADAYVVKSVIHDWDDERSRAILRNVRRAMPERARLLVVEPIVPENLHASPLAGMLAHTDLNMMVVTGGRERTEAEYRSLVESAGLRVARVIPTPAAMSIVEAVPAGKEAP
jgi:O-methyltransferase/methyltransferase family protein